MDRRTVLVGTLAALFAATRTFPQQASRSQSLKALFDQFMEEYLDLSPQTVTNLGMDIGSRVAQKSKLDDGSEAGIARQKAMIASQLARLRAFDRSKLSAADAISYDTILYGIRATREADARFRYGPSGAGQPYLLSQKNGSYQRLPSFLDTQHTIDNRADADAYLARLNGFSTLLDQELEAARHDWTLGVTPPDFVLAKTLIQMQALLSTLPEQCSLTTSLVRRAGEKNIPGDHARRATEIVKQRVYPALGRQISALTAIRARAAGEAGIWRLPDGDAYYAASLTAWTTTAKQPAEIHHLGLMLVEEHSAQIDILMRRLGMTRGTVGERLRAMYQDPNNLYANTDVAKDVLLADLNARVRRLRIKLPRYFGALPKADVEIRRVPMEIEAAAGAHYDNPSLDGKRNGIYWINLRDTAEAPKWGLPTLTYHESIPGHHLQLSMQQEANLHLIRKVSFYSAYGEGWALYAEQLAAEMGEYDNDPLGHIGQLQASMYRAARLVVDSGLHSEKWSRERSVRYFIATLGYPEKSAITEVERYCVWPGQACAYMLGKLAFLTQRKRAQARLGAQFDIRQFHDAMLLAGGVPLDLLERLYTAG
jgi:uncharacterized protein (DUF885 family)